MIPILSGVFMPLRKFCSVSLHSQLPVQRNSVNKLKLVAVPSPSLIP